MRQVVLILISIGITSVARADEVLRFGRLATLAPLCGLRDEEWSFDLRRAEIQAATGSTRFDDEALRTAPRSPEAVARLSSAEHDALEEFTTKSPSRSCQQLRAEGDLADADAIVHAFRKGRRGPPGS